MSPRWRAHQDPEHAVDLTMPRPVLIVALVVSVGCRPERVEPVVDPLLCDARPMEAGEVRVRRIPCSDEVISGGDAGRGHWMLENQFLRVGIRDVGAALTRLNAAGGTVVDLERVGSDDFVLEATPLIGPEQAWFVDAEIVPFEEEGLAGIEVIGTLESGREDSMRYILRAGGGRLELEGVDGLELAASSGAGAVGEVMQSPSGSMQFATDGTLAEDLGGWMRWDGVENIAVGTNPEFHTLLPRRWAIQYGGVATGDYVEAWSGDRFIHRVSVSPGPDQPFAIWVPPTVDRLRVTALGHTSGEMTTPGNNVRLQVGARGVVDVDVRTWDGEHVPTSVYWNGARWYLSTGSGRIYPGPGLGSAVVSAGPQYEVAWIEEVDVYDETAVSAVLQPAIEDPPLLAALGVETWPDATNRSSSSSRAASAAASGVRFVVTVADDEVAASDISRTSQRILAATGGSRANTPNGRPYAFPWGANSRRGAHGAAPWQDVHITELLGLMSPADTRYTVVDPEWVDAVGDPDLWGTVPDALQISSLDELPVYLDLLDRWRLLALVGPLTWLDGTDPNSFSETDAVAAIVEARTVATTGPLLTLRVEGQPPGADVSDALLRRTSLKVQAPRWIPLDTAALIGPDGELMRWSLPDDTAVRLDVDVSLPADLPWVVAIAWSEDTAPPLVESPPWAATSAIMLQRP